MTLRRFSSVKKFLGATVRIYLQGDPNVTSRGAAALLQNDAPMITVANRVIAIRCQSVIGMRRVKAESPRVGRRLSTGQRLRSANRNFLRSVLRSEENLLQNCAILRNALRKRSDELPSVSNDMQSSETLRNSLGLNYKSAALNQLSYARRSPYT